jgi:hypothetical protein
MSDADVNMNDDSDESSSSNSDGDGCSNMDSAPCCHCSYLKKTVGDWNSDLLNAYLGGLCYDCTFKVCLGATESKVKVVFFAIFFIFNVV